MTQRGLAGLAVAGLLAAALVPERFARGGPTLCPIRRVTGRPCPACGLTRSWNAAARLKLRDSVRFHPIGLPALGATALVSWQAWSGRRVELPPRLSAVMGAAWLAAWLGRLATPDERG